MSTASQENEFVTSAGVLWDDPESGKTWLVSLMGTTIIAALVIALSVMYFHSEQNVVEEKVIEPQYLALKDLKTKQQALLASSGSYSVEVGGQQVTRQRIPVDQAIAMMAGNPALAVPTGEKPAKAAPGKQAVPATPATPTAPAKPTVPAKK